MNAKNLTRNITKASTLVAIGLLLPYVVHFMTGMPNAGVFFLPMHIPVLLAGFFLPLPFTLAVCVITPLLSSATGMPLPIMLISMIPEFMVYGTTVNLLYNKGLKKLGLNHEAAKVYTALLAAMIAGRIVAAPLLILQAVVSGAPVKGYFAYFGAFFTNSFVGMILQILIIPPLILRLIKILNPAPAPADYFNEKAAEWDGMVYHDPAKVARIVEALDLKPIDAVLDVGCGTGVLAPYLYDKCESVLAIDEAEKMIETAAKKYSFPNVEFKAACFEDVVGRFDKIIMYSMFPHFNDQKAAVTHAAALLKRGGRLLIAHSQSREQINGMHVSNGLALPPADEFAALFQAAGLTVSQYADSEEMFYIAADK